MPVSPEHADVAAVHQAGVDGFVVYSVRDDDPHFMAVLERPVPTVVCDQPTGVEGVDRVGVDDRAGMLELSRYVTGLGHRRVGVLCMRLAGERNDGPATPERQAAATYPVQRARLTGLRDGLAEVGVDWAGVPVFERFDHSVEAGKRPPPRCSPPTRTSPRSSARPTCWPWARCGTPPSRSSRSRSS